MYFEVDGEKIYSAGNLASNNGSKPVIVLLHGAGMDSSAWVYNTRYFSAQGRSVLAIDFPNHGLTKGSFLTSIEAMASWVLHCLDTLGVNDFSVGGHSMGALVALEIASTISAVSVVLAKKPLTPSSITSFIPLTSVPIQTKEQAIASNKVLGMPSYFEGKM